MRVPVSPHLHLLLYVFFTLTALLGTSEDEMDGINNLMDMSLSKLWVMVKDRKPGVLQSMGSQKAGMTE